MYKNAAKNASRRGNRSEAPIPEDLPPRDERVMVPKAEVNVNETVKKRRGGSQLEVLDGGLSNKDVIIKTKPSLEEARRSAGLDVDEPLRDSGRTRAASPDAQSSPQIRQGTPRATRGSKGKIRI